MLSEAGMLEIPFTTGILVGIGETRRERVATLLAIRDLHDEFGHIQEVIVQSFTPHARTPMEGHPEPGAWELAHAIALSRLVLPPEVSIQAPPNLTSGQEALLVGAGVNDFGGISPVTPDYINLDRPWPHIDALAEAVRRLGFQLRPRLPIYERFVERPGFLNPALRESVSRAREWLRAS
jgi:FO synthase